MSAKTAFWRWAVLGAVASGILLIGQVGAVGGVSGLLQVGVDSDLRTFIEGELGDVPLSPGPGHDGQIYYAIGLDLAGDDVGPLLDHPAYRYRRVLYPALSSAFGLLGGHALLVGMVATTIASTAVAAGGVAWLARRQQRSDWWALAVLLNPGVWLSVRLLTADATALALMVAGLIGVTARSSWNGGAFALSALAKDAFLVTPAGLAGSRDRRRWKSFVLAAAPLGVWALWLTLRFGDGLTPRGNLSWPFQGLIEGSANWSAVGGDELFYLGFAIASVVAGIAHGVIRHTWLRWPIIFWSVLALISSNWVWDFGNNAARVCAPLVVLIAVAAGQSEGDGSGAIDPDLDRIGAV